jgi:hypothetical protein
VVFGVADERLGTERIVFLWEGDDARAADVAREVRKRVVAALDIALGDVRLVPRGWILKTSNGKLARAANRETIHGDGAGEGSGSRAIGTTTPLPRTTSRHKAFR